MASVSRAAADKRISNARMMAELKVKLRYPYYRHGLKAILAESGNEPT